MKKYISKEDVLRATYHDCSFSNKDEGCCWDGSTCADYDAICRMPPADVKPVVRGVNLADEYAECDQFICSKCGIHLQDWNLIEDDYEDGIVHEFVFNFCPNCGADMRERSEEE